MKILGKKNCPCVDYFSLDSLTIRDSFPIPLVSKLLYLLFSCCVCSKFVFKSAGNILCIALGDELMTPFCTPLGLFKSVVIPFGLANTPACF